MSRRTRKQLVGKKDENRHARDRERNLESLAVLLRAGLTLAVTGPGSHEAAWYEMPSSLPAELLDMD
jgi:hypothetical protein